MYNRIRRSPASPRHLQDLIKVLVSRHVFVWDNTQEIQMPSPDQPDEDLQILRRDEVLNSSELPGPPCTSGCGTGASPNPSAWAPVPSAGAAPTSGPGFTTRNGSTGPCAEP